MVKKFRIPTDEEIKTILKWGGIRIVIAIPQMGFYAWKQLSRLSLHCASGIEALYCTAVVEPFDALIWSEPSHVIEAQVVPELLNGKPELFDWNLFRSDPDRFPHIRIIAKSGMGKTTLAEWLLPQLGGQQFVITPKKKPSDWRGQKVYGAGFNFEECVSQMSWVRAEMYRRFDQMESGIEPGFINFVADEWRLVVRKKPEAKEEAKEVITVARDAKIRMIAIAQGEQVGTWGLEGESDLEECFTTIRMGQFAIDYAKKLKLSSTVLTWLQNQKRPCMVENQPAEVPDLTNFGAIAQQFQPSFNPNPQLNPGSSPDLPESGDSSPQTQNLGGTDERLWELIQVARLADPNRSDDWLAKNLVMPRCQVGRPKALAILAELQEKFQEV